MWRSRLILRWTASLGRIRLGRAVAADDSGQAVNPDGIKNQVEGAIVQAASWTLQEQVAFDRTRIKSRDWATYPILRFEDVFRSVEVHVIDRPGQPYLGTGEGGQGPTAAAIANAVAACYRTAHPRVATHARAREGRRWASVRYWHIADSVAPICQLRHIAKNHNLRNDDDRRSFQLG